eukprot:352247-Hanusia_phi.AAC.1
MSLSWRTMTEAGGGGGLMRKKRWRGKWLAVSVAGKRRGGERRGSSRTGMSTRSNADVSAC